ncbi:tRNA (uracil-5-)-methyltransferase, partial [Magnaporthiopsis poae ATCC 64411]
MQRTIARLSNRIWSPTIHSIPARPWQVSRHPRMPSQATAAPSLSGHDTGTFRPSDSRPMKRPAEGGGRGPGKNVKKFKKDKKKPKEGGNEEVLAAEIEDLLATLDLAGKDQPPLPETDVEFDVRVVEQSSTGDGLALQEGSSHVYVVPFAFPGDTVRVKVHRHGPREQRHSLADFVSVVSPSPMRDDSRVRCQYYGRCGGCNFQPLSYEDQLAHKRRVVERAFAHFSGMPPGLLPPVGDTIGSPLQYGYRTKLTPHFDGAQNRKAKKPMTAMPDIGFLFKGRRRTLDIEDCPIGTEAVRRGMKRERARMAVEYGNYSRGATILLRESTQRFPKTVDAEGKSTVSLPDDIPAEAVKTETDRYVDVKTCVSNPKGTSTEYIDDFVFENEANSFFQNNNSILPTFTAYVREHILPPAAPTDSSSNRGGATPTVRNLIDAYSGSGLFTIALSPIFGAEDKSSIGIDIDEKAIQKASENAVLNGLQNKVRFVANDAAHLFSEGAPANMDPDETVVVLDPPRKGCDAPFLRQLLAFGPRRVLYVSCNVHTQA